MTKLPKSKIKSMRECLARWPARYERTVDNDGTGVLCFAVYESLPCGCRVIGNGTLQLPLTVELCAGHAAVKIGKAKVAA